MIRKSRIVGLILGVRCMFILVIVSGCGQTLVFAERDGVNLAVRTDATASVPLEINFGLNRVVGSIVPPVSQTATQQSQPSVRPRGEAVNMFAGFQVDRFGDQLPRTENVDLRPRGQTARGGFPRRGLM